MIKTIFLNLALLVLKTIYAFIKIFPTENKITFISRQSNKPSVDIKLLSEALKKSLPNYKIVVLSKKIDDGLINKICYCFHINFSNVLILGEDFDLPNLVIFILTLRMLPQEISL